MKKIPLVLAGAAAAVVPVIVMAPKPEPALPEGPAGKPLRTVADVVTACRASGKTGWDLVDEATSLVYRMYTHYSCWHLWLSPEASLEAGHGYSGQYNIVLGRILEQLGFEVRPVHAARVRLEHHPWYHTGHSWLRVTYEGKELDVCASRLSNTAGNVAFVPVTEVLDRTRLNSIDTTLALGPIVVASVWRSWLAGSDIQSWMYRPFGLSA
ncbi:arylamine N-acetyltransferase [Cutibacterium modestum]|jgi:hypothetical protein|uniref:arylamine N-acetyltransferase n=1 Tax=Cutibacterium modestum TaxID=2559073 RepID=UPI001D0C3A84|nr:arylamine N-acetyltransferase [Cutibacterium modestum]MCP2377599.1 hypothetical protein [Cutibacterium modestum 31N]MCW6932177.1 arylamine N-acetyltransferase [Escherichia coli]